ncbi:hypothetical protein [Synechococcus elongatus]|uniref:Uncharacterized protein n=2 Tax=Synechococcus elongatus TaxID=32046 RepID=Q31MC4_SYNE7|nr:hypothetical protein [Synechococcus elongatus]ABB57795.1 conserved hypothetical protein [Synechococcus elongatus PCC 7942 = FACHB-805]AJD57719.1 hypothetical protein M744_07655 [Synechococcus elongatus UTEX 2973]MBD2586511.1 hypothetical protein [Synechococcus elongatus FACHB-242]MBD2687585.1 hypothetical protein [Synechococcus elongatus FACHB-1061]MBD2706706.1 hypothetical protein [Synechococcus elongatus PCC 7942 = FACHB-805]
MTLLPHRRQSAMLSPGQALAGVVAMGIVAALAMPSVMKVQQQAQLEEAVSTTERILRTIHQNAQSRDRDCSFSLVGLAVSVAPSNCWSATPLNFANISSAIRIDPDSTLIGPKIAIFQASGNVDLDGARQGRRVLVLEHSQLPGRRCIEVIHSGGINSGIWDGRQCD